PVRTTRSRETYAGLAHEFRPNLRMIREMMVRPRWMLALLRHGYPRFATIADYAPPGAWTNEVIAFARARMGGAFSWEEVKRYRDAWKGPMAVKGVLHPEDAAKAMSLGIDGIWVSNHGGRQIEALMPSIDVLPAIVAEVGKKATIVLDSGIRSGQDVMRALALGADAAFAGKTFLWAVAALGDDGPDYLIDLYIDELRASLGQIGSRSIAEARRARTRHPGAVTFEDTPRAVRATRNRYPSLAPALHWGHWRFPGTPLQGAASGSPFNVGDSRIVPAHQARRHARAPQRDRARGRAGACRRQQYGDRFHRQHRRRSARARKRACDLAGYGHGFRNVASARCRSGPLRAITDAASPCNALGFRHFVRAHFILGSDERQFLGAAHRHFLRRPVRGDAPVLPLRRGRYGERCPPSEGRILGAGGWRVRRRARPAARHLHQ